jgi:hypothetical protein
VEVVTRTGWTSAERRPASVDPVANVEWVWLQADTRVIAWADPAAGMPTKAILK